MTLEDLLLLAAAGYVGYKIAKRQPSAQEQVTTAMLAPVPADQQVPAVTNNYFVDEYGPDWGWGPAMFWGGSGGGRFRGGGGGGGHHGGHHH